MAAPAKIASAVKTIPLPNGRFMPQIALGTFEMKGGPCVSAVTEALRQGYRHIDTAAVYRNEADVAEGIKLSGVPRADIFITSKLRPHDQGEGAYEACLQSLRNLGTDYLDLYLIHWPGVTGKKLDDPEIKDIRKQSWLALQRLYTEGKCRAIGVSNYMPLHLDELCAAPWCEVKPMVNQFELHPLLKQQKAVNACARHGIVVEAYSSLARGSPRLLESPVVLRIAEAHKASPAQVALAWALAKGFVVLPKSTHAERIASNLAAATLALTTDDVTALDALEETEGSVRTCWDPTTVLV
jgi:2,5-diketo-D-gluconate reductase A